MPTETMDTARIDEIVAGYPPESRFALAILQDIQHACNYIPREALPKVEAHIGTTEGQLYALATFYKALSLTPKGRHVIKLCDGTACHMRGANNLVGELTRQLSLDDDGHTDDGQFSLELVNCLGSCALAPVMVIDETYYGKVTMEALPGILSPYRASRDAHDGKGGDLDE